MGKSIFVLGTKFTFFLRVRLQKPPGYPNEDCIDSVRRNKRQVLSLPKCLRSLSLKADCRGPLSDNCLLQTGEFGKHKSLPHSSGFQSDPGKGMILGKSPSSVKSNSWKGYLLATPPAAGGLPTSVLSDTSPCPSQQTSN